MNPIDTIDNANDPAESSLIENLQSDVERFSNKLTSYCQSTERLLADNKIDKAKSPLPVSLFTAIMFALVVGVTLLLNVGMVMAHASPAQLAICNGGIAVLHVLVGMCVISDLTRGKTYFQNEREKLAFRLQNVADQLRDLIQDRTHWATEATECKWATDNEKLKLEMAKQQFESHLERRDDLVALIEEKEHSAKQMDAKLTDLNLSKTAAQAELAELTSQIAIASDKLESRKREYSQLCGESEINLQRTLERVTETESLLATKAAQLAEIEAQKSNEQLQLETLHHALERSNQSLQDSNTEKAMLDEAILILNREIGEMRLSNEVTVETTREERAAADRAIADANGERERLVGQIDRLRVDYEALVGTMAELQHRNVQLVNEAVALDAQASQQRESISLNEARLRNINESLESESLNLSNVEIEHGELEQRVSTLLTQLADLECLSAVKVATESNAALLANEAAAQAAASQAEVESSKREELEAIRLELEERQMLVEESFQNSHKLARESEKSVADAKRRVDMLTEKADQMAEQVEEKAAMLFSQKQELMAIRAEVRELEAAKELATIAAQELETIESKTVQSQTELAQLSEQIASCQNESNLRQAAIAKLESERCELRLEMEAIVGFIADQNVESNRLRTNCESLAEQTVRLEESRQIAIAESETANDELTAIQSANLEQIRLREELAAEHAQQIREFELLSDSIRQMSEQASDLEYETERLAELKTANQALESQIESATRQLEELDAQQEAALSAIESLKETVSASEQRVQEMDAELQGTSMRLAEEQAKHTELESDYGALIALHEEAKFKLDECNSELKDAESRVGELAKQEAQLEGQCNVAMVRLQSLTDEVDEAQGIVQQWTTYMTTLQADQQEREKTIKHLDNSIEQLQDQESKTSGLLRDLKNDLESAQTTMQDVRFATEKAEVELRGVQKELDIAVSQRDAESARLTDLRTGLVDLRLQTAEAEQSLIKALPQLASVQDQLHSGLQERDRLEQSILELIEQERSQTQSIESNQEEYESLVAANREAAVALEIVLAHVQERRDELNQLTLDIKSLEAKKEELLILASECEERQSALSKLESDTENAHHRLIQLETELAALESSYETRHIALDKLACQVEDHQASIRKMEEEIAVHMRYSSQLQSQIVFDEQRLQAAQQSVACKTTEADALEYQVDLLQRETGKLSSRRKAIEDSIAILMQTESDLAEAVQVDAKQSQERQAAKSQMEAQLASLETSLATLLSEYDETMDRTKTAGDALVIKVSELKRVEAIATGFEQQIAELEGVIRTLRESRMSTERDLQGKLRAIGDSEAKIVSVKATLAKLDAESSQLVLKVASLNEKCSELETQQTNTIASIAELTAEKEKLESELVASKMHPTKEDSPAFSEVKIVAEILSEVDALANLVPQTRTVPVSKVDAWDSVFATASVASRL